MNIYQDLFDVIAQYIYGGVELTAHMDLVATTLATCGSIFVFILPFIPVWWLMKRI